MKSYCVFCKTGSENTIAQNINSVAQEGVTAVAPARVLHEKRRGVWVQRKLILLPGYIFIYSENERNIELKPRFLNIYGILKYETGMRELNGSDYEYSMWVYRHNGSIEMSTVIKEGSRIKVIDGPLLDCLGTIVKLDKHKRKVWIEFDFDGQSRTVQLSAECVTAA